MFRHPAVQVLGRKLACLVVLRCGRKCRSTTTTSPKGFGFTRSHLLVLQSFLIYHSNKRLIWRLLYWCVTSNFDRSAISKNTQISNSIKLLYLYRCQLLRVIYGYPDSCLDVAYKVGCGKVGFVYFPESLCN